MRGIHPILRDVATDAGQFEPHGAQEQVSQSVCCYNFDSIHDSCTSIFSTVSGIAFGHGQYDRLEHCGSMARRSDGSGPKTSVAIKAMRWCFKQLQISIFQEVGNPIISSCDKQKFPTDRRESLPLPLYVIMRWERRILQSNSTIQEIIILGGLLLLLWSGLRFGDVQRSHLGTWQLDGLALRGLTWRSKTSNSATPFGICISGLLSKGTLSWIHRYLQTLDT